jgi:hypothetical protein
VKLGFAFPPEASVLREEKWKRSSWRTERPPGLGALAAVVGMAARLEKQGSGSPDG